MSSDNNRKSFTPERVQSIKAKVMVVCPQKITAKVSHHRTGAKFHSKSHRRMSSDNHCKDFTPELVQSFNERHGRMSSDNHHKGFTPEPVQNITAKVMVVCRQTITAKVSHQNWCKVSQQKSWSYVVRQSPQRFHTRTGAKYHSKSHRCMSSYNHRKSFTPELVQSITAKVMVVCCQTITAKVSHQNWCKVSHVVRQSSQRFRTKTGAKYHSKSLGCMSSDNHCGRRDIA